MIRRATATLSFIIAFTAAASAQQAVTVGTQRLISNGALFLAAAQGYFKAEGLDLEITAYSSQEAVAEAVAVGVTDFGLAAFTPDALNYAGRRMMRAVAAQVREKRDYEGNEIVASNLAYAKGVQKLDDLDNTSVAISQGSVSHYQLGQIARAKHFDVKTIALRPMPTLDAMARAVGTGQVDAAIMPAQYARELLVESQAKLISWYSDVDEQQLGALFASAKAIESRHAVVEKFVRAYRRGAADYADLVRIDHFGKRVSTPRSRELATIIARYVYPGQPVSSAAATVEAGAYYMDPQARLDVADLARQVAWYKAQGLIDRDVEADKVVDLSFSK
jgi:NitT/TauT family transport system substrate-binding protein